MPRNACTSAPPPCHELERPLAPASPIAGGGANFKVGHDVTISPCQPPLTPPPYPRTVYRSLSECGGPPPLCAHELRHKSITRLRQSRCGATTSQRSCPLGAVIDLCAKLVRKAAVARRTPKANRKPFADTEGVNGGWPGLIVTVGVDFEIGAAALRTRTSTQIDHAPSGQDRCGATTWAVVHTWLRRGAPVSLCLCRRWKSGDGSPHSESSRLDARRLHLEFHEGVAAFVDQQIRAASASATATTGTNGGALRTCL